MPSEKARQEKQRRNAVRDSRGDPGLTPREREFYPEELGEAVRLIQNVAAQLKAGGRYDKMLAEGLEGVAWGVEQHARGVARSKAARDRRFWKRF